MTTTHEIFQLSGSLVTGVIISARKGFVCGCGIFPILVLAQEAPLQTLENFRLRRAGSTAKENQTLAIGQNRDIGDIQFIDKSAPPSTVTFGADQSFFYSDNVLLTETERIRSIGWAGNFNVDLVPYSTYRWTPSIGLDGELFRYHKASAADFDAQILTFASDFSLDENRAWTWDISYSLWRLTATHGIEGEFYKQGELINSFSWFRPLNADESLSLRLSAVLGWRHVTPSSFDRISAGLEAALSFYPVDSLEISPFAAVAARYYYSGEDTRRRDLTIQSGASVNWSLHRNVSVGAVFSWVGNYSTADTFDYDVILPSLSLGANIHF